MSGLPWLCRVFGHKLTKGEFLFDCCVRCFTPLGDEDVVDLTLDEEEQDD